jgi:hypothetical protein
MKMVQKLKKHYESPARAVGDLSLLLIPVMMPIVANAPLSDDAKYWANAAFTVALITLKFISKLWQK